MPPRSPYGLIQEDLFPDEWKCLVACMMLNCTSRKQVEKVITSFFKKWPDADSLIKSEQQEISAVISPLGFKTRRTQNLLNMSRAYVHLSWTHAKQLPGIGDYASRAWEIFFKNELGEHAPKDGALVLYWKWRKNSL